MITTDNRDETKDRILDAALKRFIHFGAGKTTMNEIAEDLRCSKASLYYYFPDKQGLHLAVLEKISEHLFQTMEERLTKMAKAADTLLDFIGIKYEFGCKFFRLEIFKLIQEKKMITPQQFRAFRDREHTLFTRIFEFGNEQGEFFLKRPATEIASLYQDVLEGIRFVASDGLPAIEVHNEDFFAKIVAKQRAIAQIFINGLKYKD